MRSIIIRALMALFTLSLFGCDNQDHDVALVAKLKANKPTLKWQKEVLNGSWSFSSLAVTDTDTALDNYIVGLAIDKNKGLDNTQLEHVKTLVLKLNELDIKYDHFIESFERDQLYFFIDGVAKEFGYVHKRDITEQWRDW